MYVCVMNRNQIYSWLKVPLIRNKIFGMCTIWVILGVNVIYLSVMRNLILINFFTVKFPVICYHFKWIFVEKTAKENCFAIIVTVINTVNQYFLGCKPFSWRKLCRYSGMHEFLFIQILVASCGVPVHI